MDIAVLASLYPVIADVVSKVKGKRVNSEDLNTILLAELITTVRKFEEQELELLHELRDKVEAIRR